MLYIALNFLLDAIDAEINDLTRLCVIWGVQMPTNEVNHFSAEHSSVHLKWERHTKFVTSTFSRSGEFDRPFENPVITLVNDEWPATLTGALLAAIHFAVQQNQVFIPDLQEVVSEFEWRIACLA